MSKSESDSPSPLPNSRVPVERSPRSVSSKPTAERKPARLTSTPPDVSYRVRLVSSLSLRFSLVCLFYYQMAALEPFSSFSIATFLDEAFELPDKCDKETSEMCKDELLCQSMLIV